MIRKILGRLAAVRPLAFAFFALASFAASAFDTPYLTFRSAASFSLSVSSPKWDGKIEYSTDTENWTEWNGSSVSAAQSDGQYRLYLRGENNTNLNGGNYSGWSLTGSNIYCEGDIEALRDYNGNPPAMAANCCRYMFSGQSALVSAPSLSATTLNSDCYEYMFRDCTGLKSLPELPATALASYCYYQMFDGCTSLEIYDSAPDATWNSVAWSIPAGATGGGYSWASGMFGGTGGTFTGAPTAGTTYYVASALPLGQMYQAVNSGTLTPVFTGSAANWDLSATIKNGVGNLTFTYANGTLPPGVAPSGSSLVGTPTATGTYNFTLSVTDADNNVFNSATYSVVIMAPMATVSTPYIDASGAPQTHDCLELNANVAIWDQAWYVVAGNLNFGTGGITVNGNVNLVLANGTSMTVVGGPGKAGINVPYGSSLTIYGQSGGTGTLTASGNSGDGYSAGGAGIGGNNVDDYNGYQNCGTIVINGGTIVASGGNYVGAGIGGGNYGYGGTITINGGTVTATGGSWYGAGIGGGNNGNGGTITINGGVVNATGGNGGAGIGGGSSSNGGTIRINGGNVTATAGDEYEGTDNAATGIGNGSWGYGTTDFSVADNVTVKAGAAANPSTVLEHGTGGAITIGTQRYFVIETEGSLPLAQKSGTSAYTVYTDEVFALALADTINGGAKPYSFALKSGTLPAGLAFDSSYENITGTPTTDDVEEKTVELTVTDGEQASITAVYTITATTRTKTITYIDGTDGETVLHYSPTSYTPGSSSTVYLPSAPTVSKEGYTFVGWYRNSEFTGGQVRWFSCSEETTNLTFYANFSKNPPASYSLYYYDYDESAGQTTLYLQPSSYTEDDLPLSLPVPTKDGYTFVGWCEDYVSEVTITTLPIGTTGYKMLYAKWTENGSGGGDDPIDPTGEGDVLVTFLDANGESMTTNCTPITAETSTLTNGGWYVVNANVTREGTIAVEGAANLVLTDNKTLVITNIANFAAGVIVTNDCSLTIYGQEGGTGTLNVTGGLGGAAIGGGYQQSCGAVTINGGRVDATSGNSASAIGGGAMGNGGEVRVNGGYVKATSIYMNVPGIGKGLGVSTSNGTLYIAPKMVVKAGEISILDDEDIKTPDPETHILEIQSAWTNFLIEEGAEPVGTYHSIQYRDEFGYIIDGLSPTQYEEGVGVSLATAIPSKAGFMFAYWYEYGAEDTPVTAVSAEDTEDKVFYVKWTPIVYSITYYLKGAPVALEPSTYTATNYVTMLPEQANGYYVDWYDNDQLAGDKVWYLSHGSYGNTNFWAKTNSVISYTAEFYDGGTLLSKPYKILFDVESDTIVLPRTAYKDGYRFIDWYDNVGLDGDPVTTIPAGSVSNKQFYAKWEATTDPVFTVDSEGNLIHLALNGATEITIPDNVYSIDFHLCSEGDYSAMTSLVIPGTVTNVGYAAFFGCTGLTNLTVESGVKTIEGSAFFGCTALTCGEAGLYIPDSVIDIGDEAFCNTGLTKVSLPGAMYSEDGDVHRGFDLYKEIVYRTSDTVFYIINGLLVGVDPKENTDITIPARVDRIGAGALHEITTVHNVQLHSGITNIAVAAFSGCTGLQSIVIPASVECIGNGSFYGCSGLTNLTIEAGVKLIDSGAFYGCSALTSVVIPGSVERVADMAFWDCVALSSLTIEYGVKAIEEFAFAGCTSLVNITLPKGLEIERFAFVDCTSLKSVNISGSVVSPKKKLMAASPRRMLLGAEPASDPDATSVGDYAFIGCSALESARIGSKVNEIGGGAFAGCAKLASITVEEGNDNFKAEDGMLFSKDCTTLISAFGEETSLVVSNSVVTIADGAFAGYETLQSVVLPSGVTTIGEAAFSNATVFASITIPASVTTIGANAFCDTALATVYVAKGDTARVKMLVEATGYAGEISYVEPSEEPKPSIPGDSAATVTGDAESGYVVTPSTTTGTVEVEIPSGLDPAKVTVEVPATASVKPNGAAIKVVNGANDITAFLDIPAADANGVINLGDATVKDTIIEEVLDPEEGAVLVLTPENPSITTAETRAGLTYTFYEGTTLQNMAQKATKVGDGSAWTPAITVKGGSSGFYSVHVTK